MSTRTTGDDRRSQRTRRALRSALEELLGAKPLSAITVTALAARADINRATFYLHYAGPGDVLLDVAERHLGELAASFLPVEMDNRGLERPLEHMVKIFRHVKAHAAVYRAILLDADLSPFHPRFMALFHELGMKRMAVVTGSARSTRELIERETVLYATVGATVGVVLWWLRSGLRRSPEYMAERLGWLLVSGAYPLLGLRPPSVE